MNISVQITDAQREAIEKIEESLREQLGLHAGEWNSVVRPNDQGGLLKCKVNVGGPKAVPGPENLPTDWPQAMNTYITLTSVYHQARAAGPVFEATALDFGEMPKAETINPFEIDPMEA